ncbi:MAG TPA: hypothetical protein VM143_16945 [Acidimicrobiales bacterium]|nr:hypothetical protein [Acidimicrobiales bacterium]
MTTTTPALTAVDRLLEAIVAGRGASVAGLYAEGAVLDATVPGWRFRERGGEAIAAQYAEWFADPGTLEELDRQPVDGGEVLTYLLAWTEGGVPHAAHHCHRLTLDAEGLIAVDQVFCGGRWDATLLAAMEEAEHAG